MQEFNSIKAFKNELINDTTFQEEFKTDPVKAVANISDKPWETDKWIYRIVVFALGAAIVAIVIGVLTLIGSKDIKTDENVPTLLTAIGSGAIGALAGLLAPSPKRTE